MCSGTQRPAGQYQFHGHVRFADGRRWGSRTGDEFPFDPAVLVDDDGRVYLYSGFQTKAPFIASRFHDLKNTGCVVMELEADVVTIKDGPRLLLPCKGKGDAGDFAGHEFFEASSIRKMEGKYVRVNSLACKLASLSCNLFEQAASCWLCQRSDTK